MSNNNNELVTVALGGFGVLSATQWANGLSRYEVEDSNCTFNEVRNRQGGYGSSNKKTSKVLRAVFLDQTYQSSIKEEHSVEETEQAMQKVTTANPRADVLNIFGKSNNHHKRKKNKSQSDSSSSSGSNWVWPASSANSRWAKGNVDDYDYDEEEEEEEEDEEHEVTSKRNNNRNLYSDSSDDDDEDNDNEKNNSNSSEKVTGAISKAFHKHAHRPTSLEDSLHQPWWQWLTAPHYSSLDRVVSFVDLPKTTETGGWSQLRSFGFGYQDPAVRSAIEESTTGFLDNLRKEIEACDRLQGIQIFVDSDSVFGGIASYLSSEVLADEYGIKRTLAISCFPDPGDKNDNNNNEEEDDHNEQEKGNSSSSSATASAAGGCGGGGSGGSNNNSSISSTYKKKSVLPNHQVPAHLDVLSEDHRNLNRGLATSILSQSCAGYVPFEMVSWQSLFDFPYGREKRSVLPGLTDMSDDVCTSSIVASWTDSVLMPCRGVVSTAVKSGSTSNSSSSSSATAAASGSGGDNNNNNSNSTTTTNQSSVDAVAVSGANIQTEDLYGFTLPSFLDLLRPSPTLRVAAAYSALPFLSSDPATTKFSQGQIPPDWLPELPKKKKGEQEEGDMSKLLFNILDSNAPLLNMSDGGFRPLSGIVVDPTRVGSRAQQVVAHHVTLRGGLPFITNDRNALRESLLHYTLSLRSPAFVAYAIREPAPLSGTFPRRMFVQTPNKGGHLKRFQEKEKNQQEEEEKYNKRLAAAESLRTVTTGAQALTTNAAGSYLEQVRTGALRKNMNLRGEGAKKNMSIEEDTWREVEEDLAALRDAYEYEDEHETEEDGDNY